MGNNPAMYTDPFGLCKEDDYQCHDLVRQLRAQDGSKFQEAAEIFEGTTKGVKWVAANSKELDPQGLNSDKDPNSNALGRTTPSTVYLNSSLQAGDRLITAAHEAFYHVQQPNSNIMVLPDALVVKDGQRHDLDAFNQLPKDYQKAAPKWSFQLFDYLKFSRQQ